MLRFFEGFGADDAFGLLRHGATIAGPLLAASGVSQGEAMTAIDAAQTIVGGVVTLGGLWASLATEDKAAKRAKRRAERAAKRGR